MTESNNEIIELERNKERQRLRRIALVSFPLMMVAATLTIFLIQMSGYAGTMEDTQLGFNAETIRNYFSLMSSQDLGLFIAANLGDYLFILLYGIFFYSAGRLISWNYVRGPSNKIGLFLAWVGVVAAILDGIENVFLLSMTADPVGFASWLALAHSSLAFAKFLFMYAAMGWTMVGFVLNRTPLASWLKSGQAVKGTPSMRIQV
ncbi:MAG: hypothetical protein RTU63_08315 [Candidatus Thorarchaeota archaeon]